VTREISALGTVDGDVVRKVLKDYRNLNEFGDGTVHGGADVAQRMLEHALGAEQGAAVLEAVHQASAGQLARLQRMEPRTFAGMLLDEHPQTIAVILAHLDHQAASKILTNFPTELASDVLLRIAQMDMVPPEMLAFVEEGLKSKTDLSFSQELSAPGGPDAVAKLLIMTRGGLDEELLEKIDEKNAELAAEIKSKMLVFDDLLLIDGKGVQRVLREVDNKELAMALKGAGPELMKHIRANMSERAGSALEEEIELLGAVRVKDVQASQQAIMQEVRQLEDAGEIVVRREGAGDEFVT